MVIPGEVNRIGGTSMKTIRYVVEIPEPVPIYDKRLRHVKIGERLKKVIADRLHIAEEKVQVRFDPVETESRQERDESDSILTTLQNMESSLQALKDSFQRMEDSREKFMDIMEKCSQLK